VTNSVYYHVVLAFRDSFAVSIPDIFHSCQRVVLRLSRFPAKISCFALFASYCRIQDVNYVSNYLIAVDYYSNFIEVDYLPTMTSSQMIGILKKHFARYGIPSIVMSDNGPQFVSREFEVFLWNWKVNHATYSSEHHKSNGKAEADVTDIHHYYVALAFRVSFAVSIPDIFHSCQRVVLRLSRFPAKISCFALFASYCRIQDVNDVISISFRLASFSE
jgi:hypothetical protein